MLKNIDHANVIHYGYESLIIKTVNNDLGKPTCLKVLKEEYPSKETLARLENEFNLCSKARASCVRKAVKRDQNEGHEQIVLEYIEGKDLGKLLTKEKLTFVEQLHLAKDIAEALSNMHKENIFHRRIQPSNIIIEDATDKIFFIDFGVANEGKIFEENTNPYHEKEIEVLKYIAPEQTGRINQTIDNRADLYSFGIILYQLFTGQLPFESDERLELMYANIARTPANPKDINKNLPPVISAIIMKLLSKNAEDRYQSAFGVKRDLEKCLEEITNADEKDIASIEFPIASSDFSGKLNFTKKLYGRGKEINFLNTLYKDCESGEKKVLLLSGNSGSGKSSLVEEFKNSISQKNGIFLKGKFDQINPETPYPTIVQSFKELIQFILASDKSFQAKWKKKFVEAIGNSGSLLTQFMPGIENLVGKQTAAPELKGIEAQNRFNYEFTRFFESIADKDTPVVIFTDDLQRERTAGHQYQQLRGGLLQPTGEQAHRRAHLERPDRGAGRAGPAQRPSAQQHC